MCCSHYQPARVTCLRNLFFRPLLVLLQCFNRASRCEIGRFEGLASAQHQDGTDGHDHQADDEGREPGVPTRLDEPKDDRQQQEEQAGIGNGSSRNQHPDAARRLSGTLGQLGLGQLHLLTHQGSRLPREVGEEVAKRALIAELRHHYPSAPELALDRDCPSLPEREPPPVRDPPWLPEPLDPPDSLDPLELLNPPEPLEPDDPMAPDELEPLSKLPVPAEPMLLPELMLLPEPIDPEDPIPLPEPLPEKPPI